MANVAIAGMAVTCIWSTGDHHHRSPYPRDDFINFTPKISLMTVLNQGISSPKSFQNLPPMLLQSLSQRVSMCN